MITVKDQDFHMLNKENYMSLIVWPINQTPAATLSWQLTTPR
jgi:hypothetical protein